MDEPAARELTVEVRECEVEVTARVRRKNRLVRLVARGEVLAEGRGEVRYVGPPVGPYRRDPPVPLSRSAVLEIQAQVGRAHRVFAIEEEMIHMPPSRVEAPGGRIGQPTAVNVVVPPACAPRLTARVEVEGIDQTSRTWSAPVGSDGVARGPLVVYSGTDSLRYSFDWNGFELGWQRVNDQDLMEWHCKDIDRDGVTTCLGDCDDWNAAMRPGLPEVAWDDLDNDCDGTAAERTESTPAIPPLGLAETLRDTFGPMEARWWGELLLRYPPRLPPGPDLDGDGAAGRADCDDRNPLRRPGAAEVANCLDDDCDGSVDEDVAWEDAVAPGDARDRPHALGLLNDPLVVPLRVGGDDPEDWLSVDVGFWRHELQDLRVDLTTGSPGWRLEVVRTSPTAPPQVRLDEEFDELTRAKFRAGPDGGGRARGGFLTGSALGLLGGLPAAAALPAGVLALPGTLVHDAMEVARSLPGGGAPGSSGGPADPWGPPVADQAQGTLLLKVTHEGPVCPAELRVWLPSRLREVLVPAGGAPTGSRDPDPLSGAAGG